MPHIYVCMYVYASQAAFIYLFFRFVFEQNFYANFITFQFQLGPLRAHEKLRHCWQLGAFECPAKTNNTSLRMCK